jgi:hypothetical protein
MPVFFESSARLMPSLLTISQPIPLSITTAGRILNSALQPGKTLCALAGLLAAPPLQLPSRRRALQRPGWLCLPSWARL